MKEAFEVRFTTGPKGEARPGLEGFGYAALQIVLSYFEMIGSCVMPGAGNASSSSKSRAGIRHVLEHAAGITIPEWHEFPAVFYKRVRCGQYHGILQVPGVILDGNAPVIAFADGNLVINPHQIPTLLEKHLVVYCNSLSAANGEGDSWTLFDIAFRRFFPEYQRHVLERKRLQNEQNAARKRKLSAQKLAGKSTLIQLRGMIVSMLASRHDVKALGLLIS